MPTDALVVDGLTADVKLTFDIDTAGQIRDIIADDYSLRVDSEFIKNNPASVLKKLNAQLTEEAKRLLLLTDGMWEPACINGHKVTKSIYTTIDFSAYDERLNGSQQFLDSINKNFVSIRFSSNDVTDNAYKQRHLFSAGVQKMKEHKTLLAIAYFLQAAEFNKNDINSFYNLGICYYRMHDVYNACKYWNEGEMLGDAEAGEESQLLAWGQELRADVLKVGHHGSDSSSTAAWLAAVQPRLALISCGRGNRFGHPAPATLERLRAAGVLTERTDEGGTQTVEWEKNHLTLTPWISPTEK